MKRTWIILLVLALGVAPAAALADSTLRVQGNATLSVAPDTAVLQIGYAVEETDSSAAQQETAQAITKVVEAVKALGVTEDDIVTSYLNTYPTYDYTDNGQTLRGYRVEHMLAVTVRDLGSVGDVLDAALEAGANTANSIRYTSSEEKEVYLKALALAIEDAAAKAEAMSVATGMWLGSLEEVSETGGYAPMRYASEAQYDMAAGSIGSTLMTGDLQIAASVELVYEIR